MARPAARPIGLEVAATAKAVTRAFNDALAEEGGTQPMWLILMSLKVQPRRSQQDLAHAVGIGTPTLTRHLDGLEQSGLVVRERDPQDRRNSHVTLTRAGEAMFLRLRGAAVAFDRRLRGELPEEELDTLRRSLARLVENVAGPAR